MNTRWFALSLLAVALPACGVGNGGTLTPTVAPGVPADVAATPGNRRASLRWTSPTAGATFSVKRSLTSGGPYFAVSVPSGFDTPTSYIDAGLSNGVAYYYVVSASNQFGASADSEELRVVPGFKALAVASSSSSGHSLFVLQDRTLWACGANDGGQLGLANVFSSTSPVQVGLTDVTAAAAGAGHSLALRADGTVWAWGDNSAGQCGADPAVSTHVAQPAVVSGLSTVVAVAAGRAHSVALTNDGRVWVWGDNTSGQLGNGSTGVPPSGVASPVDTLPEIAAIASGSDYTLAVARNGMVWSWGSNSSGQLGQGASAGGIVAKPAKVLNFTGAVGVAGGTTHSLAIRIDGTAWAWGDNGARQFGASYPLSSPEPLRIPIVGEAEAVAAGDGFSFILRSDGSVLAFGRNTEGECGQGNNLPISSPTAIPTLSSVAAIAAGSSHGLSLGQDGAVAAWGYNNEGQVGNGQGFSYDTPVQVPNVTDFTQVSAGMAHSVGLRVDGSVWTWGVNRDGQLGNGLSGSGTESSTPTKLSALSGATTICAAPRNTYVVNGDGSVWAWGANDSGQVGQNSKTAVPISNPVQVKNLTGTFTSVVAGDGHVVALRSDGTLWGWGRNDLGQLGTGSTSAAPVLVPARVPGLSGVTAISAGWTHTLALMSDGSVWAWGADAKGQIGDGSGQTSVAVPTSVLTGAVAIAANDLVSFAVASDGTLWGWGSRDTGQMAGDVSGVAPLLAPMPVPDLGPVRRVAAGVDHVVALKPDGTIWSWGWNLLGALGTGESEVVHAVPRQVPGVSGATALSAGGTFTLALLPDGSMWGWGSNEFGRLGYPYDPKVLSPETITH